MKDAVILGGGLLLFLLLFALATWSVGAIGSPPPSGSSPSGPVLSGPRPSAPPRSQPMTFLRGVNHGGPCSGLNPGIDAEEVVLICGNGRWRYAGE